MKLGLVLQLATLFSVLIGGLGLAIAIWINREQLKTQVFLALSARYDELLRSSLGVWQDPQPGATLPDRTEEMTILALRYFTLMSVAYVLFLEHGIPGRLWQIMLFSAKPRLRNPLLAREWEHLRPDFENFPEFVALVGSLQDPKHK
jgi:hypothetical protein